MPRKDKKLWDKQNPEKVKAYNEKCILLCSNCHREVHWKIKREEEL
jgi:predicted HNH restriction endonuclease